ncbi:MAG: thrombospondin type 3 repeat-containing protein, partial [bacterium]|nr:thrombospondin type 3 repeat-containing protein [bacterium]
MAHSTRTLRIAAASLLAVLMVGGTYLSTGPNPFFGLTRIVGAQSSEELLREYAAKDSDSDGLPDWQEALYGTDPFNPESFRVGILDGEAVAQGLIEPRVTVRAEKEPTNLDSIPGTVAAPSSLTDRFSQTLL